MDIGSILVFLFIGGLAGWAASLLMGTSKQQGIIANVVIGVIGAVIGGYVFDFFGFEVVGDGLVTDFVVALVGAVVLIAASKLVSRLFAGK